MSNEFKRDVAQALRAIGLPGMMVSGETQLRMLRALLEEAEREEPAAIVDRMLQGD